MTPGRVRASLTNDLVEAARSVSFGRGRGGRPGPPPSCSEPPAPGGLLKTPSQAQACRARSIGSVAVCRPRRSRRRRPPPPPWPDFQLERRAAAAQPETGGPGGHCGHGVAERPESARPPEPGRPSPGLCGGATVTDGGPGTRDPPPACQAEWPRPRASVGGAQGDPSHDEPGRR